MSQLVRPFVVFLAFSTVWAEETLDLTAVQRIRTEALESSHVMEYAFYLTDIHGPRVTNSPGFHAAADWAVKKLEEVGLSNVRKEKWGPFGRGWSYSRFSAHIVGPVYQPLVGFPFAWSPGTNGAITGEVILAPMREPADFERYKGKLKGKIVLIDQPRLTPVQLAALGKRYEGADLSELIPPAADTVPAAAPATGPVGAPQRIGPLNREPQRPTDFAVARRRTALRNEFLKREEALAVISAGTAGDGGTVFATSMGSYDGKYPDPPPAIVVTPEHYNRIVRLLEAKQSVKVELEVKAQFHAETTDSYNIIAELPGGKKKDEVVMIGAHFDSWHGGTGATDNAAGSSVMMEAMRVLKSLGTPLDRTVRIALWSGEEQGLLGSRAYVKEHFASPETMQPTAQHSKLAAYFNFDNGTGKVRGVYLQGNNMVRPIFSKWLEPFHDLGAGTLTTRNTRGTDHLAFDEVGLPGFQFVQDPIEYQTRTHHSNMDVYDHLVEADLKQAAAVIASFAYHAAMRPEPLPRKPLPKPRPRPAEGAKPNAAQTGN
jgi:hypothetical protein